MTPIEKVDFRSALDGLRLAEGVIASFIEGNIEPDLKACVAINDYLLRIIERMEQHEVDNIRKQFDALSPNNKGELVRKVQEVDEE